MRSEFLRFFANNCNYRFRILLREINLSPEKEATLIVQACTHLHNFLRMKNIELYYQGGLDVENTAGDIENADWKSQRTLLCLQQLPGRNISVFSKEIRLNFSRYLNSEQGAVQWQDNFIQ